jgi:hypothetical protein
MVVWVRPGCGRKGDVAAGDLRSAGVEGRADGCPRLSAGVTGEISASDRRSGDEGLQQRCAGHELSSPIDGMGHCRGWQPGPKVSMTIMRPPQHGQAFHSLSS